MIPTEPMTPPQRIQRNLLAAGEKRLLAWLCPRLPKSLTPDRLTGLALVAAFAIGAGYALSNLDPGWLILSVAGFFVHWFGDSLDGTIARYRGVERPRFGYFIDHSCDGLATLVILGGIGVSPYLKVEVAMFTVAGYLLLSLHTFLLAKVADEFPLSHLGAGPTEARLILIALTLAMAWLGPHTGRFEGFNAFDIIFGASALVMIAIFLIQTFRVGRTLAAADRSAP